MRRLGGVALAAIVLTACGSTVASRPPTAASTATASANSSPSAASAGGTVNPSPTPSPDCATQGIQPTPGQGSPPTAVYLVTITTDSCGFGWALHTVTLSSGIATDRIVAAAPGFRQVLAAGSAFAVVVDGGQVDGSNTIGIVDLNTGATRAVGTLNALGIGALGSVSGALSPDQSHVAIGAGHKVVVIDVTAGSARTLVTSSNDRFFLPMRWTAGGILADERPFADWTTNFDLVTINASSGAIATLNSLAANSLSPGGKVMAVSTYSALGDGPCGCQSQWANTLNVGPPGGTLSVVAREKDRNFWAIDVRDDGEVLYASDISGSATLVGDLGVYVSVNGHSTLELPTTVYGQWGGGALVDASTALLEENIGGYNETAVELVLVHLCLDPSVACTVTTTVVSRTPGVWATTLGIAVVHPAAA